MNDHVESLFQPDITHILNRRLIERHGQSFVYVCTGIDFQHTLYEWIEYDDGHEITPTWFKKLS